MDDKKFKAALSKSKGRDFWCVIFKHPLRSGKDGKPGLRVRRGLGTTDQGEAQTLVDELNQILGNEKMWSPSERKRAEQEFSPKIVNAFYDNITPEHCDPWAIREEILPLPSKEEKYVRALMVGTTGAGKTTVVRQLIGTDPEKERFPSTSAAKTTISNIEIITHSAPPFKAVVSFFDKNYVRRHIEECVVSAVKAHLETGDMNEVENRFLVHSEQRFRLSYLLGSTKSLSPKNEDEFTDDEDFTDEEDFEEKSDDASDLSSEEKNILLSKLTDFIFRIKSLSEKARKELAEVVDVDLEKATKDELEAIDELIEEKLDDKEDFQSLVDDVFDEVEDKFDNLMSGDFTKDKSRWPSHWVYESEDRTEFIKTINRFSSNYAPNFGCLLTPLVEGIRVKGPFKPTWPTEKDVKLVLMDGEGLGHVQKKESSISTSITKRFQLADAIILVDHAAQAMLEAPTNVLRSLVSSGHHRKLIVCFTHFDQVKGVNFSSLKMRKEHVLDAYDNSVVFVGKALGESKRAERVLRECKSGRIFFMSNTQNKINAAKKYLTFQEFKKMMVVVGNMIIPPKPTSVEPIYDDSNLVLNIQKAAQEFHKPWEAKLSLKYDPETRSEHWARIKALTRRLGEMHIDEYNGLQPVADLINRFQTHLYLFIENPTWNPDYADDEMKQSVIDKISQELDSKLHAFFSERLFTDKIRNWYHAYSHRGNGSTRVRAYDVRDIYNDAAPIPGEVPNSQSSEFVKEIRTILQEAVKKGDGRIEN